MRTLILGLAILASVIVGAPGKSEKITTRPQPEAFHCPLVCGQEVTCADGRVFCNCCLARQAGEKNCTPCNF